jgi:hypothetical protein
MGRVKGYGVVNVSKLANLPFELLPLANSPLSISPLSKGARWDFATKTYHLKRLSQIYEFTFWKIALTSGILRNYWDMSTERRQKFILMLVQNVSVRLRAY